MIEANIQTTHEVEELTNTEVTPVIKISQIIEDLENGLTRDLIRKKYNFSMEEIKHLFNQPALKGKRAKRGTKKIRFTIVDDTTPTQDNIAENANEDNLFELNN
jgi:hypothetical protein